MMKRMIGVVLFFSMLAAPALAGGRGGGSGSGGAAGGSRGGFSMVSSSPVFSSRLPSTPVSNRPERMSPPERTSLRMAPASLDTQPDRKIIKPLRSWPTETTYERVARQCPTPINVPLVYNSPYFARCNPEIYGFFGLPGSL
jgi:hypothetical protein